MKVLFKSKMLYISLAIIFILLFIDYNLAIDATKSSVNQFYLMIQIVPPIFILIGLMDVWVPRETMIKLMGEKSGFIGISVAFIFGTFAAGPLVGAFPLAMIMLKKGARYANVLFFLMMWASAKIPIIFFQVTTLGLKFTVVSNIILILMFLVGSFIVEKLMGKKEIEHIVEKAKQY
ncbi:permease [Mycoplasmatota bacterium]|nr:permease [Mycoplasmatota bacterium]